jgi:hypothetical protein
VRRVQTEILIRHKDCLSRQDCLSRPLPWKPIQEGAKADGRRRSAVSDPLSPEDCRAVPSPCLPIRTIALLGWVHRNDHLLELGVARCSDAGDEIDIDG